MEPISVSLSQLASFVLLGFFLGGFYEIIRIIRLFRRQSDLAVCVTDFLFLTFAGIIAFAYSMELGNGQFRWFYVAGMAFGATVYFLTIGRLISLASNLIVRCVKRICAFISGCVKRLYGLFVTHICVPLRKKISVFIQFITSKIGNSYGFIRKNSLNSFNHLKSKLKVVYNIRAKKRIARRSTARIQSTIITAGEKRNVIKGNIRSASPPR